MTFNQLSIGEKFWFTGEDKFPFSGIAKGPWIKTGKRTYTHADKGGKYRVGSIRAEVRNPSRARRRSTKAATRANASKRAKRARVSKALKKFMESIRGKGKTAGARVKKNPGGSITIIPVKIRRKR